MPDRQEDPETRWVRELNRRARTLNDAAASLHPSAWPEQLGPDLRSWLALARRGPAPEVRDVNVNQPTLFEVEGD